MAPLKFLHFLTVVSLAVLQASFDALPVNALAVEHGHLGRGLGHAHADIAKKRDSPSSKKCRPRPTNSPKPAADNVPAPSSAPSSYSSQPAHTTTSSQPPTYTPSGGGKSFLAWSNNEQGSLDNFISHKPMIYNWKIQKYTQDDFGGNIKSWNDFQTMEFIPTIHGLAEAYQVRSTLTKGYATKVFNINEPDVSGMSVSQWYGIHMEYIQPLVSLGYEISSPTVTTSPKGFIWLKSFMEMCGGNCGISFMNIHHYSIDGSQLVAATNQFYDQFKLPIWYGEVGCEDYSGNGKPCDEGTFNNFYHTVMEHVKSDSRVAQIAWFGFFTPSEISGRSVDPNNVMMNCPGGTGSQNCVPNQFGYDFLSY